jgi:monoamine oxidase
MGTGTLIGRRAVLTLPALVAGCGRDEPPAFDGGWLGADPVRGHALRVAAPPLPAAAVTRRCAVAVVGGGVAGLAAARALLASGIDDIRLFELEDAAGGNARGHAIGGLACPQGAHYLPLPGPQAPELAEWLHQIGLLRQESGRTVADERHLCHAPQERLWMNGPWIEGLLPPVAAAAQLRRFAQQVEAARRDLGFSLPTRRSPWTAGHAALDAQTFAAWLDAQGLDDPGLRWSLDYACRDDYGAGAAEVSAWAGLHYFASRDGFAAPGAAEHPPDPVFTWPEGNAWLVRHLAAPLGDRLHTGATVRRIAEGRHEVAIDVVPDAGGTRWLAQRVIVAVPLHAARRIVADPPPALPAARLPQAPWLVANLALREPLAAGAGAAPAWDNVLYDPAGRAPGALGYVDALHQLLHRPPGRALITAYWALPGSARPALLAEDWRAWAGRVVAELARAHPDLPRKLQRADLSRFGHAMAIPAPGVRSQPALQALAAGPAGRLHFAHSDLAGYSVFEEAFTAGDAAGRAAAAAVAGRARPAPRPVA